MTIKEMIKKIDNYNEVADAIGGMKMELRFTEGYSLSRKVNDYKSFKKYLKAIYINEAVTAIINYNEYEFNKQIELNFTSYNDELKESVEFSVCSVW